MVCLPLDHICKLNPDYKRPTDEQVRWTLRFPGWTEQDIDKKLDFINEYWNAQVRANGGRYPTIGVSHMLFLGRLFLIFFSGKAEAW